MARATAYSITPSLPRALPPSARSKVAAAIEAHLSAVQALTEFLDEADAQLDELEDCFDDEPSLGSVASDCERDSQVHWFVGANDGREEEHDGSEPSLAAGTEIWSLQGGRDDLEGDLCDGYASGAYV